MLFIVELIFLGAGIYAAITAKLPEWFVGKGYYADGPQVRLLGLLMVLPLPVAFCAGFALALIDSSLVTVASIIEIAMILGVSITVLIALRKIRKPVGPASTEKL